jgi:predicted RND superfamily exporter protein
MEEQEITKEKSLLEKIAPFILIVLVIIIGYFGLSKFNIGGGTTVAPSSQNNVSVVVDIDFLNSATFTSLNFIPDSAVFDEATGIIPSGRDDPFAPVN